MPPSTTKATKARCSSTTASAAIRAITGRCARGGGTKASPASRRTNCASADEAIVGENRLDAADVALGNPAGKTATIAAYRTTRRSTMAHPSFHGVFPYLVSPIDAAGQVKSDVLARLCEDLIDAGVHGLAPLGSTGEFAYLTWEQQRRVVEVVVEAARGRVPVVAGVASTTTAGAEARGRTLARAGGAGLLAMPAAYRPTGDERLSRP